MIITSLMGLPYRVTTSKIFAHVEVNSIRELGRGEQNISNSLELFVVRHGFLLLELLGQCTIYVVRSCGKWIF